MKGMIFAAGVGSRLKPWTDSHPKALAPVGGRPAIDYVVDRMLQAGVSTIVVNVHHFARQIVDHLERKYPQAPIVISDESDLLLNTGGGLLKAAPLLDGDIVLVHNADILTNVDLPALATCHSERHSDATLLVQSRDTKRYLLFDGGRLSGWTNISTGEVRPQSLGDISGLTPLAFGGMHVVGPAVFEALKKYAPAGVPFSITDFYIDNCRKLSIDSYTLPAGDFWFDIGRPETLAKADGFIRKNTNS